MAKSGPARARWNWTRQLPGPALCCCLQVLRFVGWRLPPVFACRCRYPWDGFIADTKPPGSVPIAGELGRLVGVRCLSLFVRSDTAAQPVLTSARSLISFVIPNRSRLLHLVLSLTVIIFTALIRCITNWNISECASWTSNGIPSPTNATTRASPKIKEGYLSNRGPPRSPLSLVTRSRICQGRKLLETGRSGRPSLGVS